MLKVGQDILFLSRKIRYIKKNVYLCNDIKSVHVRLTKAYGHYKTETREDAHMVFSRFFYYLKDEESHNNRRADS